MTDPEGATRKTEPDVAHTGFTVLAALGVAVLLIVVAGAVGVTMGMSGGGQMMWGGPDGRVVQAELAAAGFQLDGMPAHMVAHYEYARSNADVYAQIPCFCGCQDMLGHRNLEDCFVTPDGAWESHAAGCQVCIDESQMVTRMMTRGMGPQMMRDRIVGEFGGPMMGMGS
ncbi:MAG: hypothetical protein A2Z48_04550 [Actinobacteria bacterium RBG_19FT_COMBO_70_19]|jgi:hypothetical protein|nr:MAG: hypothetical protein A2Z48_04550 [Actinobacteria bacterium RBG_19FT_COMBO_70_19]